MAARFAGLRGGGFILRHGRFRHAVGELDEGLVSRWVPLFVKKGFASATSAGIALSVGQVGRAVGVAVEDEKVLAVDNPTETEFADPAQLLVGRCRLTQRA